MAWLTSNLLTRIRRDARLSSNDTDWTDAVLLDVATGILHDRLVPLVVSVREEYYNRYEDTSLAANQQAYAISSRAAASTLREVVYVGTAASDQYELIPVSYRSRLAYAGTTASKPSAYCIEDDRVLVLPTPSSSSGSLRLVYEYRPGVLVATSACMAITGGVTTGVLTGSEPGWSTASSLDIIKATPPFALISADLTPSAVSAGVSVTFTLTDLDTTRLAVGDYVCNANESCIPQLPVNLQTALAAATVGKVLRAIGDTEGAMLAETEAAIAIENAQRSLTPRVKGRQKKIMNPYSPLRRRGYQAYSTGRDDGQP